MTDVALDAIIVLDGEGIARDFNPAAETIFRRTRSEVVGRFMVEAKAACSIKSNHSATVFDVGRTPEGVPFLVMEFLEGHDLATVMEQGRLLDVREVAEYGMQVCEALAVAHVKGIVHRDIKPENLFLETRAGMRSIKVLDFGISKTVLTGSILASMVPKVKTQDLMGTPLYMSPEQVRSPERVDARTDIWSLGIVMYEVLTGTLPFLSDSITELCAAILEAPIAPITGYRSDLPPELVEVIEKCLEKDVEKRYQNVAELALALLPFAPKRARICAERAAQVLVAAGLVDEASVRFPSSMPSSMSSSEIAAARLSGPVPPHFSGSFALAPPPSSFSARPVATETQASAPAHVAPKPEAQAPVRRDSKKTILAIVACVVGLLGVAGAVYIGRQRSADASASPAAAGATAEPTSTPTVAAAPSSSTSSKVSAEPAVPADTASAEPAGTGRRGTGLTGAAVTARPGVRPPSSAAAPHPKPTTPGTGSVTAPAATGKKPDTLDIGY